MSEHDRQRDPGLSEQELQDQEARDLPDREVMSLLGGASSHMAMPGATDLPGLDAQAYPGADKTGDAVSAAGGTSATDLPAYSTSDTNSVQSSTSATDSATS